MKFAEHLSSLITPEWRKQYIRFKEMENMLYSALKNVSQKGAGSEEMLRCIEVFDAKFFNFCERELEKIETFFAKKLSEATYKFFTLKNELKIIKSKLINNELKQGNDGHNLFRAIMDTKGLVFPKRKERLRNRQLRELRLGFSEFYLNLLLLQSYQHLNFTGFVKILKRHDKLIGNNKGTIWRRSQVENAPFHLNKDLTKLIDQVENIFTEELEEGLRRRAMKRLRIPTKNVKQSQWTIFKVGFLLGTILILLGNITLTGVFRDVYHNFDVIFRLYRATFLIILFIFFIGINVYGWRASGVNYVLIFELNPRKHLLEQHLMELASILCVLWCTSVICYLFSDLLHIPRILSPFMLCIMMLLFLFNPTRTFHRDSRFWFLKVFARVLVTPLTRVKFADLWLADQFNSMSPIFIDVQLLVCTFASAFSSENYENWQTNSLPNIERCSNGSGLEILISRAILNCLPAWFRFSQCLRRYYDENCGLFPHFFNAMKYFTTFPVVLFSTLNTTYKSDYDKSTDNPFFTLWIIAQIFSSCYYFVWDIKVDWGFLDLQSQGKSFLLKDEIVYSSKNFYYFALIEDFILRFVWILSVSLTEVGIINADLMLSILAPLEIFRRFIWNFFRVENEHMNNCGKFKAVRDISIAPTDLINDQAKLIKLMDEPDGSSYRLIKDEII